MTVQIGSGATAVVADRGTSATLAVWIMDSAQGLQSADLTITYDTSRFTVAESGVTASTYVANLGWTVTSTVDSAAGTIAVSLSGGTALPAGTGGTRGPHVSGPRHRHRRRFAPGPRRQRRRCQRAQRRQRGGDAGRRQSRRLCHGYLERQHHGQPQRSGQLGERGGASTAGDDLVLGVPGFGPPTPSSPVNDYPAGTLFHSLTLDRRMHPLGQFRLAGLHRIGDHPQSGRQYALAPARARCRRNVRGFFGARLQSRARSTTPAIC